MFYILSQATLESSTDSVCQWLSFYKVPHVRMNGEDFTYLKNRKYLPNDDEVNLIWYRRKLSSLPVKYELKREDSELKSKLRKFFLDEFNTLHSYLYHTIKSAKWINDPFTELNLNKLHVIDKAKEFGLEVPYTEVVSQKSEIFKIMNFYPDLIVKPLSECIFLYDDQDIYKMLTKSITEKKLKQIPDVFYPSLIQERIEKIFEIRTFYFYGKCYSMAIFSQENKATVEDFRNYDFDKPNRTVPYKLPDLIEERICKLMGFFKFNTGSIDLLVTVDQRFIFLEINPEGQFGMVSVPCNYHLEKKIVEFYMNKHL